MAWTLADFGSFAATVFLGVVGFGAILCVLPDLFHRENRRDDRRL